MKHLYLLGNGFDLSHKFKTSYFDFIDYYLKEEFSEIINNYKKGNFTTKTNVFYSIYPNIIDRTYFTPFRNASFSEFLLNLRPGMSNVTELFSILIDYYISKSNNQNLIKNWFDVEQEFYNLLTKYAEKKNNEAVATLNEFFGHLITNLKKYIQSLSQNITSDPLIGYTSIFTKHKGTQKIILDFNYTPTFERKYAIFLDQNDIYIPIHGRYDTEIIFGYGDEMDSKYSQIENIGDNTYLKYFKSFQYFNDTKYDQLRNRLHDSSYIVSIIGHSCGLSDRLLLNEIFENKYCQDINIYHYTDNHGKSNYTDLAMNISRHFKDKSQLRAKIKAFDINQILPQANL